MTSLETSKRPLRPEDLFQLTMIGDVAIDPAGEQICFVQTTMERETNSYRSDLWVARADGRTGEARQFTHGPHTVAQPRWSPDGRWIAFLADREQRGRKQLWLIPACGIGGEARPLTSGDQPVSDFAWSPDSAQLAFTRNEKFEAGNEGTTLPLAEDGPVTDDVVTTSRIRYKGDGVGFTNARRSHLWVIDLAGQERRLTEGETNNSAPGWSPDGQSLVFVSKRLPGEEGDFTSSVDLWVVPASGGEARRLATPDGPADAPVWSPDGRWIAFIGNDRPNRSGANSELWIIASDESGSARNLSGSLDLDLGLGVSSDVRAGLSAFRPVWSPDSGALYALASVRGDTPLWRIPLSGEATKVIAADHAQVQSFALSADGSRLALNLADNGNPGDLYSASVADPGTLHRLTDVNGALFSEVALSLPEDFTYEGAEGWSIHGWLVKPVTFEEGQRHPLILAIHGGPHAAYGNSFFFDFQLWAAQGYGVLFTNPRGSTNYGEVFTMASNDDWGGNDYRDVLLGVDAAIARAHWIDPQRLGVTGGSYGGYLTNWIVTQSDRFRVAVTERSICNMTSKWGTSDIGYFGNDLQWGGPPWDNPQFYLERSPLTHVQRVITPLLIIHSERDLRCPIEQGEQFFSALKYLRRPVEFVRFPDEGHELSRSGQPLHRLERLRRMVGWFQKYLG